METVLLADDERIFKAVEGTCLRRERCRLLKAPAERLLGAALERRPDLLVASVSDQASLKAVKSFCAETALDAVPVIIVDFGGAAAAHPRALRRARSAAGLITIPAGGRRLDVRLDAAIKQSLPVLDRASDRVSLSLPVRCRGRRASFTMRTKNISPSGLFLKTDRPLACGERFSISFSLPADPSAKSDPPDAVRIEGTCEVVRHVVTGSGEDQPDLIPGMGVRFVELEPATRSRLVRFVRTGGVVRPSRSRGRAPRAAHSH